MKSAQIDVKEYSYFVNNQWRKAAENTFFEVHEPYSGDLFARVAAGSCADARAAVDAAAKAFRPGRQHAGRTSTSIFEGGRDRKTSSKRNRRNLGLRVCKLHSRNGANILPWRAVISPVAAGNTVVVKPSEFAAVSAGIMLAEVAEEAGFPARVINVLTHASGAAGPIADEFFERPEVRIFTLIGGVKTARMFSERAGRTLNGAWRLQPDDHP